MLSGNQLVSLAATEQQPGRDDDVTSLFSQHSNDNQFPPSAVPLRAAFVSSPRYHRYTCPADLATAGTTGPSPRCGSKVSTSVHRWSRSPSLPPASATAGVQLVFDAPPLAEETLMDVSLCCCAYAVVACEIKL